MGRGLKSGLKRSVVAGLLAACLALPAAAQAPAEPSAEAQAPQTVADIREELTLLNGQIQQIRDELVRTGPAAGLPRAPATALQRLDQLEAALRRLTNRVDVLTNDLARVVEDASNRVGDIEFRLTELEGGDVSLLGRGEPLGGGFTVPTIPPPPVAAPPLGAPQLAVGERAEFDAARAALDEGEHSRAAQLFDEFLTTYPGGPLAGEAQYLKGEALAAQGDWRGAARNYLDAFSGAPDAPTAPRALYRLAVSLGHLGQTEEACLTLIEVDVRYPGSAVAGEVAAERRNLACP